MEAVHGNPDDAVLLAQIAQDVPDLAAATTTMCSLEVEWGYVAPTSVMASWKFGLLFPIVHRLY
jgi:hypothetical protein